MQGKLSNESIERASQDYHVSKLPRPCGITVHSVVGCSYRCAYCYLPDMGISYVIPRAYGLTKEEIVYALLKNRSFLPGRTGTFIAIGSIGEPFHPIGIHRTLEYIYGIVKYLENPIQFSTKSILDNEVILKLKSIKNLLLSPLITIITTKHWEKLEPYAPSPYQRIETIRKLRKAGFFPFLFLKPIIPSVIEQEAEEILDLAKNAGAIGVVIGGLRITISILNRMKSAGIDINEILSRVSGRNISERKQVSLNMANVKRRLVNLAREKGLIPLLAACCANNLSAYLINGKRIPCAGLDYVKGKFCTKCPVMCESIKTEIDTQEVYEMAKKFLGLKNLKGVEIDRFYIIFKANNKRRVVNRLRYKRGLKYAFEVAYRRKLVVV